MIASHNRSHIRKAFRDRVGFSIIGTLRLHKKSYDCANRAANDG